jgi:sugar fermentation stimulation protein A
MGYNPTDWRSERHLASENSARKSSFRMTVNAVGTVKFISKLARGRLIKRYKRFLADVQLEDGDIVTVACPNTGSMIGLVDPGNIVWLSESDSPTRKYRHTWELVELPSYGFAGINTSHPNRIFGEAVAAGLVPDFAGYTSQRSEVAYGRNSRIDFLLEAPGRPPCYVEIKNVHLFRQPGLAEFPDCVTERGRKHLVELSDMVEQGARAVMVYLIQCKAPERFALARDLDPHYVTEYAKARARGVEALAFTCDITLDAITLGRPVPVLEPE